MVNKWAGGTSEGQAGFDKLNPVRRPMRYRFLVRNDVAIAKSWAERDPL